MYMFNSGYASNYYIMFSQKTKKYINYSLYNWHLGDKIMLLLMVQPVKNQPAMQ